MPDGQEQFTDQYLLSLLQQYRQGLVAQPSQNCNEKDQ
jgi:hypothetical protein